MLINAVHPEECRVALIEDGVLQELEIEYSTREQTKGNVYKGVITRVEPSIQAFFIDFGVGRHGFLPFSEVIPSLYRREKEEEEQKKNIKSLIEKEMRPGQEFLVQVVKEERESKGAYLTTYLSLAGRYLVLMPGSTKGGVSRKIEDESERKKLKEIISQLDVPKNSALIIRTAGTGRTKSELRKDLNNLLRVWENIKRKQKSKKGPALIYREGDLVVRSIRDYFTAEVGEILLDSQDAFKKAKDFMKIVMPRYQSRIKYYQGKSPLFTEYNLEEQIESIYSNTVPLKSGGSLVIDPTEALVSIDVNSGRSRAEKSIEDTAFKTNLEAAKEIARQLRLRDLGGLIVIDFIDMRQKNHILQVEKELKNNIKRDKARIDTGRISKFGLLEMSRQRIRSSLIERSFVECPHCGGSGTIKSAVSNAIFMLRKIHEAAMQEDVVKVDILLAPEIANDLLNRKREELVAVEKEHGVRVFVTGQAGIPINSYNIEVTRSGKKPEGQKPKPEKLPRERHKEKAAEQPKRPQKRSAKKIRDRKEEERARPSAEENKEDELILDQVGKSQKKGLLKRISSAIKKAHLFI